MCCPLLLLDPGFSLLCLDLNMSRDMWSWYDREDRAQGNWNFVSEQFCWEPVRKITIIKWTFVKCLRTLTNKNVYTIQYVIQRPMPSFTFNYLQPKDIDIWYILLPKAKLSRFSVLALAFLPICWFYNFSPIFMLLRLALLAFFSWVMTWGLSTIPVHFPVLWFGLYLHLLVPLNVRKWGAI